MIEVFDAWEIQSKFLHIEINRGNELDNLLKVLHGILTERYEGNRNTS